MNSAFWLELAHNLDNAIDPEHRIGQLEKELWGLREEHERRLDSYQCRIEIIEESLGQLAETLENITTYLQRLSK